MFSFTKQPVQSGRAYCDACNYKCREQARRLLSYTRKKEKYISFYSAFGVQTPKTKLNGEKLWIIVQEAQ